MADATNNNVFLPIQAVLNNDWVRSSDKGLTKILDEIEKIGIGEIRFQKGNHVLYGSLEQLLRVQDHLLGKGKSSMQTEPSKVKCHQTAHCEYTSSEDFAEDFSIPPRPSNRKISVKDTWLKQPTPNVSHSEYVEDSALTKKDDGSKNIKPRELRDDCGTIGLAGTKDLMVDRDIWEFIESKNCKDLRELEAVFEATITKTDDESGVLKVILKPKSHEGDLEVMLESLVDLYQETLRNCVVETAQIQLSDEESKLVVAYVSDRFHDVLVKKCIYNDDFLFIGPEYEAREARKQLRVLANRLTKGHLRTAADRKWNSGSPAYRQKYVQGVIDVDDPDEYRNPYDNNYSNEIDVRPTFAQNFRSDSDYNKDEGMIVVDDDERENDETTKLHDERYNDFGGDDGARDNNGERDELDSVENVSPEKFPLSSSDKIFETEWNAEHELGNVSHDKSSYSASRLERIEGRLKTDDASRSMENLTLEPPHDGSGKTVESAKIDANTGSLSSLYPNLNDIQPEVVTNAPESTTTEKHTKRRLKKNITADYLPKVTIVKQTYSDVTEPTVVPVAPLSFRETKAEATVPSGSKDLHDKPKSEAAKSFDNDALESSSQTFPVDEQRALKDMFREQKKNLKKKPFDSSSSSESENDKKVNKKTEVSKEQKIKTSAADGAAFKDDAKEFNLESRENIEEMIAELMSKDDAESQRRLQKLLDQVANSKEEPETIGIAKKANLVEKKTPITQTDGDVVYVRETTALENQRHALPQPPDGNIACIIDKSFHLQGHDKSGSIEIKMTFKAGSQADDQPDPGRPYKDLALTAYLPGSGDGRETLRLMKSAFSARKLFRITRNDVEGEDDVILPNGIVFKERFEDFPDPGYLPNVIDQLRKLTE